MAKKQIKVPSLFKNFFFISGLGFILWMTFLDSNDFISQFQRQDRKKKLIKERDYYEKQIKSIEKGYKDLLNRPQVLEKFAREKYLLKKKNEDVYIIQEVSPPAKEK